MAARERDVVKACAAGILLTGAHTRNIKPARFRGKALMVSLASVRLVNWKRKSPEELISGLFENVVCNCILAVRRIAAASRFCPATDSLLAVSISAT